MEPSKSEKFQLEKAKESLEELQDRYLKQKAEDLPFDVEAWYPILSHLTAPTVFLDLTEEEATAIQCYYETRFKAKDLLTEHHITTLRELEKKIETSAKDSFGSDPFFMRLSTRSPKDGASINNDEYESIIEELRDQLREEWDCENCPIKIDPLYAEYNIKMAAIFKLSTQILRCTTGAEAMNLVLTSARVYQDLKCALVCAEAERTREGLKPDWKTKVILRKWETRLDDFMEFRCFVKINKMTAISQYNQYVMIGSLLKQEVQETIRKKLINFWMKEVRDLLKEKKDYVIDMAILKDNSVFVIELNPFSQITNACLYSWLYDDALLSGDLIKESDDTYLDKVPLRILSEISPHIELYMERVNDEIQREMDEPPYYLLFDKVLSKETATEDQEKVVSKKDGEADQDGERMKFFIT